VDAVVEAPTGIATAPSLATGESATTIVEADGPVIPVSTIAALLGAERGARLGASWLLRAGR
jgi:hypothetical protein